MPNLFDKYRFTCNDGVSDTPVYPLVSGLKRRWEQESDSRLYRKKLATPLLFRKESFVYFKDIRDAGTCTDVILTIERYCGGEWASWYVGKIPVFEGKYNYSRCEVEFDNIPPTDAFECFSQNLNRSFNWLDYGTGVDMNLIIGTIEVITCFTTTNPPTNSNSVLWFYKGCWGTGFVTSSTPDVSLAWRPIVHQQHFDSDGTSAITTKWARERISSGSPPVGDGWISIGGGVYVRPVVYGIVTEVIFTEPLFDERNWTAPMLNPKFLTNARYLESTLTNIVNDLACDIDEIQSDFFNINPPADSPTNDAYDYAAANFDNVMLLEKSDVVRGNATEDATRLDMTLKTFFESILNSLNVYYAVIDNGSTRILRLEHYTWFNNQNGLDLTLLDGGKYIVGLESFEASEQVPAWEQFSYQESFRAPFLTQRINYPAACATQPGIDKGLNFMCADIGGLSENPDAGLDGFVLACTHNNFGSPLLNTLGAEANGAMAWDKIIPALWADGRARTDATATVSGYTVNSVRRRRQQARITAKWCCEDFTPSELVQTQLGWGEVKDAEEDTERATLTLTLLHE